MKSYVWLTFAFLGWGYYEMSGGSEFEPVEREVAQIEVETPEVVARADTATLLSVSTSNVSTSNVALRPAVTETVLEVAVADVVEPAVVEEVVAVVAPAPVINLDIREVAGSRVNMRMGPSTDFDVITTLNGGTKLEILEITADGWANVSTVDRGIEGWMAERLLTDANT